MYSKQWNKTELEQLVCDIMSAIWRSANGQKEYNNPLLSKFYHTDLYDEQFIIAASDVLKEYE